MRLAKMKTSKSVLEKVLASVVHKDDYLFYEMKQLWEELKKGTYYAKESEVSEFSEGVIFIKCNNSVIKNEIMLKKDEIRGLINVYLHSKLSNDKYPVKRVIVK